MCVCSHEAEAEASPCLVRDATERGALGNGIFLLGCVFFFRVYRSHTVGPKRRQRAPASTQNTAKVSDHIHIHRLLCCLHVRVSVCLYVSMCTRRIQVEDVTPPRDERCQRTRIVEKSTRRRRHESLSGLRQNLSIRVRNPRPPARPPVRPPAQ